MKRRRSEAELQRDRKQIASLYLRGWKQEDIAEKLGVGQATVSRDIKTLLAQWQKDTAKTIEERQADLEQRYLFLYAEAIAAWERSLEDKEVSTQEQVDAGEPAGEPAINGKSRIKAQLRTEGQSGNPALLAQAQAALKALREMFGTDAAIKQRQVNLNIDFSQLTDEQVTRIAGGEDPIVVVSNPGPGRTGTAAAAGPDSDTAESMAGCS